MDIVLSGVRVSMAEDDDGLVTVTVARDDSGSPVRILLDGLDVMPQEVVYTGKRRRAAEPGV